METKPKQCQQCQLLLEALRDAEALLTPIVRKMSVRKNFHEINVLENSIRAAIRKATLDKP